MRRSMGIPVLIVIVLLIGAAALAACGAKQAEPTQAVAAPDGAALVAERCTACHGLDRVTQEHKTADAWDRVVTTMIGKGAKLSDEEKSILVDYLAANYGG